MRDFLKRLFWRNNATTDELLDPGFDQEAFDRYHNRQGWGV